MAPSLRTAGTVPSPRLSRLRWPLLAGATVAASLLVLAVVTEIVLWISPNIVGSNLDNYVLSRYGTFYGGIYYKVPGLGMHLMIPNLSTDLYINGREWRHETDAWGFRNPAGLEDKSLLLLGDSLIYGFGVDNDLTLAHYLRTSHGRPAYNMALQGTGLYQHYLLCRLYLERFDPDDLVLYVFMNDFTDLLKQRSPVQLLEAPEIKRDDYDAVFAELASLQENPIHPLDDLLFYSRAWRLQRGMRKEYGKLLKKRAILDQGVEKIFSDPNTFGRATAYYELVLADLGTRCAANGTELHVVYLALGIGSTPPVKRAITLMDEFLRELTAKLEIPYRSAGELWIDCPDCLLPNEGHFSAEGNRRLAAFTDAEVLGRE